MERKIHVRSVGVALIAVLLASVALASLAFGADPKPTALKTYQVAIWSKNSPGFQDMTSGWASVVSISIPNIGIPLWFRVECSGYTYLKGNTLGIAIGVDSTSVDTSTYRYYGDPTVSETSLYSGIQTEELYYLPSGAHTFHFLAEKYSGSGAECRVAYLKITVTVFTDGEVSDASSPTLEATMSAKGK